MNLKEKILKVLEAGIVERGEPIGFSDEAKSLIHETAKECRETKLYKENKDGQEIYAAGLTAEEIYLDMCEKIIKAPTVFHMQAVPILLLPAIDEKLQEEAEI